VAAEELTFPAWVYPYRAGIIGGFLGGVAMIAEAVIYGCNSGQASGFRLTSMARDPQPVPIRLRVAHPNMWKLMVRVGTLTPE
jgi:hypothetical protein